jgi:hypothetical protein
MDKTNKIASCLNILIVVLFISCKNSNEIKTINGNNTNIFNSSYLLDSITILKKTPVISFEDIISDSVSYIFHSKSGVWLEIEDANHIIFLWNFSCELNYRILIDNDKIIMYWSKNWNGIPCWQLFSPDLIDDLSIDSPFCTFVIENDTTLNVNYFDPSLINMINKNSIIFPEKFYLQRILNKKTDKMIYNSRQ